MTDRPARTGPTRTEDTRPATAPLGLVGSGDTGWNLIGSPGASR